MRKSPFHSRTSALCDSLAWKEWSGYAAVSTHDRHSEREYFAIRHTAGLLDVTPLYKYEITGPGAGALLARVWCRDMSALSVGRVVYSTMADANGKALDDGTVARLAPEHFRVTTSEPWLGWFERHARGLDVQIEDSTRRIAALALQGPLARDILRPLVGFDLDVMRFFRVRRTKLAGVPGWISRTGYTGDLGYELYVENDGALPLWDAIIEAGRPHGLEPIGLDALDVARIEAGFILKDIDYYSARGALTEFRKSSPYEIGLGWTVDLDRDPFVGQGALRREAAQGSRWAMIGVELDWAELERLYEEYGVPPHLAPAACRLAVPVFDPSGERQVGQITSTTWSPTIKKLIGIGQVESRWAAMGTRLRVEHTVEYHRRMLTGTVVDRPFFDPEHKRTTPGRAAAPVTTRVAEVIS